MLSTIQQLVRLVPPPTHPKGAKGDWAAFESDLKLTLPTDYKEYIGLYGGGTFVAFSIPSPFNFVRPSTKKVMSPREGWSWWTGIYHNWSQPSSDFPYTTYPDVPGLLPWGIYGDVDVLGWYTSSDPSHWHVVYLDREEGFFELRGMGFSEFILSSLTGNVPLPERVFGKQILKMPQIFYVED